MAATSESVVNLDLSMEMETPKISLYPEQTTPRRSERKRALFPSASPQTSDLGHMSPLGSSPDRYSGPASPDSTTYSPLRKPSGPVSPFGRRVTSSRALYKASPRKQFAELFGQDFKAKKSNGEVNGEITPLGKQNARNSQISIKSLEKQNDIVPVDQLEQTVLSVMEDSDFADSPRSEHTPGTTPHRKELMRAVSEVKPRPLTPSKRRSLAMTSSGSTTSASPHSPDPPRRLALASKSAELPRARTSLFSSGNHRSTGLKRDRNDGIYLTGGGAKRRKTYGEINAGVRTGIRRPPKVKPKTKPVSNKKQGKGKSIWDVAPKSTSKKRELSPIKLPKMSLLAQPVKRSDEEAAALSASASLQVRARRSIKNDERNATEVEREASPEPQPDPNKRFYKTGPRTATVTINNYRIKIHKGRFIVDKSPPPPAPKRRRKLYSQEKQIEAIKVFDDNEEDVAETTKGEVQNILQKLDEDKCDSTENVMNPAPTASTSDPNHNSSMCSAEAPQGSIETASVAPVSPQRVLTSPAGSPGFLSPLSQLASSTSTLSINVGGDTLHLNNAQVQALSQVPDVIMEEDDISFCEPLPEEIGPNISTNPQSQENETKENEACTTDGQETPVKYFPIFTGNSKSRVGQDPAVPERKRKRSLLRPIGNDQYQLDAGQKRFGGTECGTCGVIYQMGEPEDEMAHQEFHDAVKDLKFAGWKQENLVGVYGRDRVVVVRPGDPKPWWTKALDVLRVVDKDLGFAEGVNCDPDHSMVFLYISDKCVKGCLLAIPLRKAHRMVATDAEVLGIDCCTAEEYDVRCGVSRIWVHGSYRQRHIASQLVDCMRKNFIFGHILSLDEVAFSSPTILGKIFVERYTGQKDFLVYTQS